MALFEEEGLQRYPAPFLYAIFNISGLQKIKKRVELVDNLTES